jgi:hypothetical protein
VHLALFSSFFCDRVSILFRDAKNKSGTFGIFILPVKIIKVEKNSFLPKNFEQVIYKNLDA